MIWREEATSTQGSCDSSAHTADERLTFSPSVDNRKRLSSVPVDRRWCQAALSIQAGTSCGPTPFDLDASVSSHTPSATMDAITFGLPVETVAISEDRAVTERSSSRRAGRSGSYLTHSSLKIGSEPVRDRVGQ